MRLDAFLMDQPAECLGIAIGAIADEALWVEAELLLVPGQPC